MCWWMIAYVGGYGCGCMRVGVCVWVYACWFTRVGACEKQSDQKLAGKIKVAPSTVSPPTDLPLNCSLKASVVVAKVRKVPPQAAPHHALLIWLQSGSKVLQP